MLTMFDTITPSTVPHNPQAVAGYVGGSWPDYTELVIMFPHAFHLPIAPQAYMKGADGLDVEPLDAVNSQAPAWYHANTVHTVHGVTKLVLYTSASNVSALVHTMTNAGISRNAYWIWSAHFTYKPHICGPATCGYPQADLTQWTDHAFGSNLDQSLVNDAVFIKPVPPVPPKPPVKPPVKPAWQPAAEWNWTKAWDDPKTSKARRAALRVQMAATAQAIWTLAHTTHKLKNGKPDWRFRNRGVRFHALWSRLHPAKPKLVSSGK